MEADRQIEIDNARMAKIRRVLTRVLTTMDDSKVTVTRRASRQVRMFSTQTEVHFTQDDARRRTVMEIIAPDRPGLLSQVGQTFIELDINIDTAKILTIGERAEDVFYVLNSEGDPLDESLCERLKNRLIERFEADD